MQINSFEDVNLALKKVAELSVKIEKINGEVTLACNEIKEARAGEIKVLSDELGYIDNVSLLFVKITSMNLPKKDLKNLPLARLAIA